MLQDSDFPTWFKNSLIVTSVAVVSQLLLCPLAGYAFARLRFIGTRTLQLLLLTTVFIPPQLLMIPVYKMYTALGIVGTLPSLFLPWMATGAQHLPDAPVLRAAAEGDRGGRHDRRLQPARRVRPRPAAADAPRARDDRAADGANAWNDFLWPLISISDSSNYTLQLGLLTYQGKHHTDWAQVMATNVMVTLPLLVVFLLGQRHFVKSLTFTAVKG